MWMLSSSENLGEMILFSLITSVGTKRIANRRRALCDEKKNEEGRHDTRTFFLFMRVNHPSDIMISLVSAHFRLTRESMFSFLPKKSRFLKSIRDQSSLPNSLPL